MNDKSSSGKSFAKSSIAFSLPQYVSLNTITWLLILRFVFNKYEIKNRCGEHWRGARASGGRRCWSRYPRRRCSTARPRFGLDPDSA